MRVHVLTTVILAFADCLLCSESQETEHGPSQHLSPNAPLSSTPFKAVASQTSLSQATNGNSSSPEEAVRYLSPFKVLRRRGPLYAGANHTFPVGAVSRSYSPGLSAPMEGRSNNSTSTKTPQNPPSLTSKMTLHYYDSSVETPSSRPISTVLQSSPTISRAASNFLPLPRTTHLSLPVSSITKPSALDSYTERSSPRDSGETDLFSPVPSATRDSGSGSREIFSSPPDSGAMNYPVTTSNTTHLSMPTFRTRYRFTPAFTARYHSVPDSPATQNASHDSHSFPTKHVQRQSLRSLDQTGFKEMTSLPLSRWPVPSQSLSNVPVMPGTTKQSATNPESSLKPVIRRSLPTLKGSSQSSFVPDSENYSSSFGILSGHPRSTLVKRNSSNVGQDKSSHSSTAPTSGLLPVKVARQSLPLFSGSGNSPRTKVVWNKSRELKPYPLIPHNSFGEDQYLLASGRTDASQSPWNIPTAPLYPQAKPSSSMFGYPPLSHFPSIPEAPLSTTTDTITRILDYNTPISSVNTNNETPRLKNHEEEATTNVIDLTTVGGNEEITAIAGATPWDKKANTTAYHATDYFLNPENLADDFLKDSTNALTGVHNSSDDSTYKEERESNGMDLDNAAPSMVEHNTIIVDNTDVLEEDFRALMNTLEFVGKDGFTVIYVPDWEEGYLTDDEDPVVLKEDGIDEGNTRSFTKGMISRIKLPVGNNDAAIPMKNVIPFTTSREIPEDVAVPTSNTVSEDVATNSIDDATDFFPKMFVRKSSTPVANKHLHFATVAENGMPTGDPVTSEVNYILSVRDSEIPIQQIILTQFKPQIILPENELNATGNAHTILLENTTAPDKNTTVYMTQLWDDNSVTENYTTLPETNTTLPKGRMPILTNMPTRAIPDTAISMVGTANPLLNNPNATPTKEAIIKTYYTITTMEDDPTMGKGQRTLSGRVIPRSSTIIPRKDIKVTLYSLPGINETFADGDTAFEGDISMFPKAGTAVEADKVILAEENTPNDNTLRNFILDDNDPKSTKDDSFLPQINTEKHIVDRTKHATNPTQSDPRVAISTAHISPSMSDRTVTTLRKVYSIGSDDVIPFMEENPEFDAPSSRDVISRSMGGGRTRNWAKTSTEEDTATENKLKPIEEYYGGSEKGIVAKVLPTSFAFGSDNNAFDVDDSDTKGFYSFQKGYGTIIFPLGDRATIPRGSHSSLTQVLDSKVDPTPLLYEMTDSDPKVPLISSMKNLKPIPTRNMADITTDGIEEIILKDKETATVKQNDEAAEDVRFFQPVNSIPGIRRNNYAALSDTDYGPAVRQTSILLDDNIKPAVISTPLWSKTPVSTITEVAMDSTIKPEEKAPPKETDDSTLIMNYINAKHDSTAMEVADPAKPILLTANTFKPDVSSAKLQETFHEKKDPFPRATRQPSELSAKNLAKIKDAALPEWQITESHHNVLPSETAFFPAPFTTPMIEPISGEHKTTFIVNGNRATKNGGVSDVGKDGKGTILEKTRRITTLPAFRENIVTVINTTRDESENGKTFEFEVFPYVEGTTTIEEEDYISNDDLSIDFSPPSDDFFDALVTEDDSIFPETDGASPSTDIFANPPNLNAFEVPVGNSVSDATKSLPKTTAPGLKEIVIHEQHNMAVPDTTSFLPKISHLGEKRSIHKAPNRVSPFTPAYAMPLIPNSVDPAMNPITLEDEGISVTKRTPNSSNNKLSLRVRTTTQATHLKPQNDDDSSIVAEISKSQKATHTITSATDPGPIIHTNDATEFVRSPSTIPATSLIKKATLVKVAAPAVSTENPGPKDGLGSLRVNASLSMGDKDVLATTDAPRIFKYDSVPEKAQGPFLIKPAWMETIRDKSVSVQSPIGTPEWPNIEAQTLVPANASPGRFRTSYYAPVPATIMVPKNRAEGDETSSLLSDKITIPSGQVLPTTTTTSSKGDNRNMGNVNKYELEPYVEKDKFIEPETLPLTERSTIVEANDAIMSTKNVRENVDQMISPLRDNIPKDYGSISEDARIALKTADTKPVMDSTPLMYGPDGFEASGPNSLSRIIIFPSDVRVTENHHTIFIGKDKYNTEADKNNLMRDPANLKAVNTRTTDDSNFSQTESSTLASLDMAAANDMDFLLDKSNPRVKKTLHSSAPDAILDRTNTNPYITDSTESNRKEKLPLVKNDYRPATYDAVGLQAVTTTTAAEPRTQEDETNTTGPKMINFPLKMDPVTYFTDSVIPYEREDAPTDLMATGAITRADRVKSPVANGTTLPGKDNNTEGWFIIPGIDTALSIGDAPLVTPETLSLLPDVTADDVQLSVFTEEDPLTDTSIIVASEESEPMEENIETINEAANPGGQIFESQRDPWALPWEKRLLIADPTSSGLFSSSFEDSASTTGNRVAITEMDSSDAPLVTPETLSLLPDVTADDTQLSVFTEEDPLTDASIIVASEESEPMEKNIETINEAANPGGQIFESQRDPWALPWEKRLLIADPTSSGLFSSSSEDSASTTGNRVAITEMDSSDAPLVTPETLSLLPDVTADDTQLSVFTEEDPLTDASIIVASEESEPMEKNPETINEAADSGGQIFESQRDPWALPWKKRLLIAVPTSSGLFSSNFEDSASTTRNRVAITEMDSSDAPLVTPETLSLLPDVTADDVQLSVFTEEDTLTDASIIVASEESEPMVETVETINEAADSGGQIFESQRDPWALRWEKRLLITDPTSSGLFSSSFEDSASTTGNRVAITEMDSSDAPLVTPETLSLLPDVTADDVQLSVFTEEDPLTDASIIVASEVSEPMVENTETINEAADPGWQIFESQRDPWPLPLEYIVLPADSQTSRFSPTSSEHSSPTMAAAISMPVKDIPSSIDGSRDNSERLVLETVPSEESSYTGGEKIAKEEIVTQAERNPPYGMAYNDFVSGNAVNRTGVSATDSVLIPNDTKMAVDRESGALRRERAGIESNGIKSPTDKTNSKTVATGNLVKTIPDVQEIAFVEEKNREADKVSFLSDTRGLGNIRSYDALPVGGTNPSATDSTTNGTMPSRETPASSKSATGPMDHMSGAPATDTAATAKAHAKGSRTAVAEINSSQNDTLPVTPTSIPAAEGTSHVDDGTEIVTNWVTAAPVPSAHAEYTEAGQNQAISEGNPSLSTGYGHKLSTRYLTLPSDQLHTADPAKEDSVGNVIRTPTERRNIEAENPSTTNNSNSPDSPIVAVTTTFQNTDTTVHVSGPEYYTLTEEDSSHEPKGGEDKEGDNDILEVTNITPFLSHDSILQRDNLAPEGYLMNSEEGTVVTLDPNGFLTHVGYSMAKATNSEPETAASEFEEIVILEKDGLVDADTAFLLPDIPERKRNAVGDDPITQERVKTPTARSRDLLLAPTKTEAFPSKDRDPLDNKTAHGEDPNEMKNMQEAVAAPVTFFRSPEADSSHANTEPLMDVTATRGFVPMKRGIPDLSKATTLHSGYLKPQNDSTTTSSEADSTLVPTGNTTLLTDHPLNFDPPATGISPETFHLKESSLDVATVLEASGTVSEKPLPINGAPAQEWNVISAQSDPQALQLESTLPPLPRTPAHTDTDTVGTVKEDPVTETATSDEKNPSPKRAISAAAPFNWGEDTDFRIRATPYEDDIPAEEMASDEYEKAFHKEEEDTIAEDDIAQEGENTPYYTYSSPFMSGNNILEGKNLDPEDGSIFYEANSNSVIIDSVNSPPQIIINEETKASDSISARDEKPSTVGDSAAQTADDNIKTITADGIPDGMIKMTAQFKGIINAGQNYSEAEKSSIFLPDVAYLPIKRKAQKDGDIGPDVDSPFASKDTRFPVAGSIGPVPFEGKDSSTLVPGDHATNNVAGAKSPEQETKTTMVEMVDSQNDVSPVISFAAPADGRMPYANTGNEYRKDLAANTEIPLTWKAPAMVAKDAMLPSEYIQPNSESTASEVGTTMFTGGGPLTALTKPIHKHLAPSDKSQINHYGTDRTSVTFKTLEPGTDNSLPNEAATMGQPVTKMKADLPSLPLVPILLPDDSSMSINKAIYTRHTAATDRKEDTRTSMVPDILITSTNVPRADIRDRINTSSYQPDIIIEESSSMEYDEIPFVEEDTSGEGDVIYLEEENTSNDDLMTIVLDNNVSAYVTEDNIIAPPSPIINTPTLTYEPSELGTYASYNKADSSYSSSEIATTNPKQTNSTETSHTIIPEYEPSDSEIYTTMLKSVAPRTIAYTSSDGSKKMSSRFLKMTAKEQHNKVVDDATTFLPATSNPKKKRTDSSIAVDPDIGFPIEESKTFTMDNFGSAGESAPIKNKEVFDTKNLAADAFTSGRNPSITAVEEQYSKDNFKTVGSEIPTSQDSTSHSELLMSPETNRISQVDENMEMVTDVVATAIMPAAGRVASVGVLPVQDSDPPLSKADVTMFLNHNPLLTHENPSLTPDAKTDSAAASLQGKNEALLDDFFVVSEETEIGVEQTESSKEDDTSVPEITLLSKDVNPLVSEDNVLSYDTDLIGGDNSNSEDNYIILEPNVSDLNVVTNSCLTDTNGLETIACMDSITITEKNGEDKFYAENLPADKAKVPMETITMTDVITDGIKTTQEITAVEEGNRAAVKVTSSEPDMPHSETIVNNHKGSYIASDWDPIFTKTDTSTFMTGSTGLAEDITSLKNQETSIPKDTRFSTYNIIDPKAEPMVTTTDATSEEKEENEVAEITNLENDVTPMSSFISHKTEDIEPITNPGIEDASTVEEETPTPIFSASTIYTGYNKPEDDLIASGANSAPVSIADTNLLKDATMVNNQETLPSKEMSLDDADRTVSEVTGPVSEKPLLVNGAPNLDWTVINAQSDPQALQLESTLSPLPRTPAYTDADTVGTVKEDPVTDTATSGEKYPSHKTAISAAATINLREDTDFMSKTARYEADISLEEMTSDEHEVAFQRKEENAIVKDGVTQEENTLYTTDFISSSNVLEGNELDPQDHSIFPKGEDVDSLSEVNKVTADLSKFAALPASPQNGRALMTSLEVPGAGGISFGNKDSDLTGDASFTAEAKPTTTKARVPTSLPSTCSEHTPPSTDTSGAPEDTLLAQGGSSGDLLHLVPDPRPHALPSGAAPAGPREAPSSASPPGSSSLEEMLPVPGAPQSYATGGVRAGADPPEGPLPSLAGAPPQQSDLIATAVNFMASFSDFISSVADKLALSKPGPTPEWDGRLPDAPGAPELGPGGSGGDPREDAAAPGTPNPAEAGVDDHGLWPEGNPDDELNATALLLHAAKSKDGSALPAGGAAHAGEGERAAARAAGLSGDGASKAAVGSA